MSHESSAGSARWRPQSAGGRIFRRGRLRGAGAGDARGAEPSCAVPLPPVPPPPPRLTRSAGCSPPPSAGSKLALWRPAAGASPGALAKAPVDPAAPAPELGLLAKSRPLQAKKEFQESLSLPLDFLSPYLSRRLDLHALLSMLPFLHAQQ